MKNEITKTPGRRSKNGPLQDLTGQMFGRWTVLSNAGNGKWHCLCECGKSKAVNGLNLRNGVTKSCGCLTGELLSKRRRKYPKEDAFTYQSWKQMRRLCNSKNRRSHGAAGITYAPEWESFPRFRADMGLRPLDKTLVRIDPKGHYEPGNCRWADAKNLFQDLTGLVFDRWTVLREASNGKWHCRCECGKSKVVNGQNLRNGVTKSCGCLHREIISKLKRMYFDEDQPTLQSWKAMRTRCDDKNYPGYGAAGITYAPEWEDFFKFKADMGLRPVSTSLDRIDPKGNYEPDNCRWADLTTQANNKTTNKYISFAGVVKTETQWARLLPAMMVVLRAKLHREWLPAIVPVASTSILTEASLVFAAFPPTKKFIDITGQRFARLLVLGFAGRERKHSKWFCKCDCGSITKVSANQLRTDSTKSCGCLKDETTSKRNTTHGMCGTPEYIAYGNMKMRCYNPNDARYSDYGGRGIKVCERWHKFENFLADMGLKPSPAHSLDRIDFNGDYCPENCRWETDLIQAQNRRPVRFLTLKGETLPISEWARRMKILPGQIIRRIRYGWTVEQALMTPVRPIKTHTIDRLARIK